jgi:hypothetical protein
MCGQPVGSPDSWIGAKSPDTVSVVATSDIDKFLKSVEGLASLDPDEIASRLAGMRRDAEMLAIKLERALGGAHRRAPKEREARPDVGAAEAKAPPATNGRRPYTWKRDAILAVMRSEVGRWWSPQDMRLRLRDDGVMNADEGTPTSLLLRRIASEPEIEEHNGRYSYMPGGSDGPQP